jgi:hypothetical protein
MSRVTGIEVLVVLQQMFQNVDDEAQVVLQMKQKRQLLKKPLDVDEKRVQKMRSEFLRMGIKPDF